MPQGCAYRVALWIVSIHFCALFSVFASSQIVPNGGSSSQAGIPLSGTVLNSVTAEPIRHAFVRIFDGSERLALTDDNGHFAIDNLPPGQATVVVLKPGFARDQDLDQGTQTVVTISPDSPSVTVKLVPQSVIYGRIQNIDREPVEGIPVKAIVSHIVNGRKSWQQAGESSTNEDGEFRIANLSPGTYYLAAGPSDGARAASDEGYSAVFYPGVTDMASAAPVEIAPGQQLDADFSLSSAPLFKVVGTLTGLTTGSAPNIAFVDRLGNSFSFLKRFNRQTGQFEAEVPAGQYILQAANWTDGKAAQAQLELNVTSNIAGLVLTLATSEPTPIIVKAENMRLSNGGAGAGQDARDFVRIHFIENGQLISSAEYWSESQGDINPSVVMPQVPPGTYTVEVFARDSWYVRSAQCGGTDLLREPLTVPAGTQMPPIEVTLRNDGAALTGHVPMEQGGSPATVIALPESDLSGQTASEIASDGSFNLPNLAPGNYIVLAVKDPDKLEYSNPAVIAQFLPRAAHVSLPPNGKRQISLALINGVN
jgi:hypothetical protein